MIRRLVFLLVATSSIAGCPSEPAEPGPAKQEKAEPVPEPVPEPEVEPDPPAEPAKPTVVISTGKCDETQTEISKQADERGKPWSILQHLEKNFPDMKVSWLMKEKPYQTFVVETGAEKFGRCNETACYLFAAPTAVIEAAVEKATTGETHDAAVLGEALGLPAANFEGPLRMLTLDLAATQSCVRLPVDEDPGVWKCKSEADKDCFEFGGYTSGGIPEVMVIDAPVAQATLRTIQ